MIPRLRTPDSTASLLREGYLFGTRGFDRVQDEAFRTRLGLKPAVVMRGRDAARFFYEGGRFGRSRAMPDSVTHLLQDEGSVQTLDGAAHFARKHEFVELLGVQGRGALVAAFAEQWQSAAETWAGSTATVELQTAAADILAAAAMKWAGVPAPQTAASSRGPELVAMIESAARFGPPDWAARARRRSTERWAGTLVTGVRSGSLTVDEAAPLNRLAHLQDADGELLTPEVAAVELLNLLRPIVAVGRFVVFAALGLRRRPDWAERFAGGDRSEVRCFVDETRRFYPFFPFIAGRARAGCVWHGHRFVAGDLAMLDLYGTNHDDRLWSDAGRFLPERFRDWNGDRNTLIPQGGGEYAHGHRCPGEPATVELMADAVMRLSSLRYELPEQDLRVSLRSVPAGPQSGFLMRVHS
ncbi:MAG TPA: cytochrome P450 [Humibacter sp.]|nr:cytochrome P450 [Humibacter sp.]